MSSNEKEPFEIRCARQCMCEDCAAHVDAYEQGKIGFVKAMSDEERAQNCSACSAHLLVERLKARAAMNRRNKNEERALAYETAAKDAEELLG